jgi:hypothetical protein
VNKNTLSELEHDIAPAGVSEPTHIVIIMTVGYYGPGYRTEIYEYDARAVQGLVGESVDLHFLEDTTLPEGKVMLYRRCVDIHTQFAPESMSISLNLMVPSSLQKYSQQYSFDIENHRISGYVDGHSSYRVSMLDIAGEIGDQDTAEVLGRIAKVNPCPRARASAHKAFHKLMPSEIEYTRRAVLSDGSALVRRLVDELD